MTATIAFSSWLRRGAASAIALQDSSTASTDRARVPVQVTFNQSLLAQTSLDLFGPGEVKGFDPRAVIRVWPPHGTADAEPNYFPLLELDEADLPWRYTPARASSADRLRPWLCLIAVAEGEATSYLPREGRVTITGNKLPLIEQSWAWSHVQVSGETAPNIADLLAEEPHRVIARLLCPRRLEPGTNYSAMLVPVFEHGRRAGLGLSNQGLPNALAPAWQNNATEVTLPVYYSWSFRTGQGGDFESLIRRLKPRTLPSTVGLRALDVSQPGSGLPAAAIDPLGAEGALRSPTTVSTVWPEAERAPFVSALADRLDAPADVEQAGGDPLIAPPLYGMWHANRRRLEAPPWYETLNADPRNRVTAGLGTEVIRAQQTALMTSAWEQVGAIRQINEALRRAQLGRAMSLVLRDRYLLPLDDDSVLWLTAPVNTRVLQGTATVRAKTRKSPPRQALFSGAWRRLSRPLGALGRRQARPDVAPAPVLTRVNDGTYVAAPLPAVPGQLVTHDWLKTFYPSWNGSPAETELRNAPPRAFVHAWDPIYGAPPPNPAPPTGAFDSPSMALFRESAIEISRRVIAPAAGETLNRLHPPTIRSRMQAVLDPNLTVPASLDHRLIRAPGFVWNPADPIEPVMAHPEFPQPMYASLAELSPDWILPGLADVVADTVTLALTNQPFIEAFMVGLNHEMSRELLWNEYPTDRRGTYFRQFWDPAGFVAQPGAPPSELDPETRRDISPIHAWLASSSLGAHSPRSNTSQLVLLVRGEVLRRYPRTRVYAVRAVFDALGTRVLGTEERAPVFGGTLAPDVAFFGFDLTEAAAKGSASDPGWFFVFQEQPSEPRFGLDATTASPGVPQSWNDLAWTHVELPGSSYIDLDTAQPDTRQIANPGGARWHANTGLGPTGARGADLGFITLQLPVRVAVHALEMLP